MTSSGHALVAGISGARRNAAVSLCVDGKLKAFCEQERVIRSRGVGLRPGVLPVEALTVVLDSAGGARGSEIHCYATAESAIQLPADLQTESFDHHHAHAATAWALSPFDRTAVLICDRHAPSCSLWTADPRGLRQLEPQGTSHGFTALFAECAQLFGLPAGQEHELEALARLDRGLEADRFDKVIAYRDGDLVVSSAWRTLVTTWLQDAPANDLKHKARVASAFQQHLGQLLVRKASEARRCHGQSRLCLGGGLFYNTYLTTILRQSGLFDDVFTTPNPGNAGASIGAALLAAEGDALHQAAEPSSFLGPEYAPESIKRTLDNCKLAYEYVTEAKLIDVAADAIARGRLVGWFQGRMEWGHRALGNRSILTSPFSPHVLANLNVYLKQRKHHRAYGVSVLGDRTADFFDGPPSSRFMEYEYRPTDPERFRHVLPDGADTLRVQTLGTDGDEASRRFRLLHDRFGSITGAPVLVNTSFNGFSEPIVCSPRDAIRVFFGTGLDLLVLDRFVLHK